MKYPDLQVLYGANAYSELVSRLFNAFDESVKKGKLKFTPGMEGHRLTYSDDVMEESGRITCLEHIILGSRICLQMFIERIANDIVSQSFTCDKSTAIDLDEIVSGNLNWTANGFIPRDSIVVCVNDGLEYVIEIKDWEMTFYSKNSFLNDKAQAEIRNFIFAKSPVKQVIEFETGNIIVLSSIPDDILDFIKNQYVNSLHEFKGRNWNKSFGEMLKGFGILRTPTQMGGTVFYDNGCLIVGTIDEECESTVETPDIIGYVDNSTWQTLVMDQSDAIKLIMKARNADYSNARLQLDRIVEKFGAVCLDIIPGTYNAYYIPEMNEGSGYDTKIVFPDVNIKGYEHLIPDMIITAHELKTTRPIDTDHIFKK